MEELDRLSALQYLIKNNPLCDNCVRADLEEIRIAAGLYGVVMNLLNDSRDTFSREYIDKLISTATAF